MRAVALRHLQRVPEALPTLELLEDAHPAYPRLFQERGHCHVFLRQAPEAIRAFSRAVELNPALPASWQLLASLYKMVGRAQESANAVQHVAKLASLATEVVTARSMLADGNLREAEELIRSYLQGRPDDIEALRVLAQVAHRNEFAKDAATLLEAVLKASPGYRAARHDYVLALIDLHRHKQAREQIDMLIAAEPDNPSHRMTRAGILVGEGCDRSRHRRVRRAGAAAARPTRNCTCRSATRSRRRADRQDAERAYREAARQRRELWRRVLEPGQPQDVSLRRRTDCDHARAGRCPSRAAGRSLPSLLRARQGARGSRRVCRVLPVLRSRQRAQAGRMQLPSRSPRADGRQADRSLHPRVLRAAPGLGLPGSRAHLHRRAAPRGFDLARADPGLAQPGRGHHGTGRHSAAGQRARPARERRPLPRRARAALGRQLPQLRRRPTSATRSTTGSATSRSSSTRCRTTSVTSG